MFWWGLILGASGATVLATIVILAVVMAPMEPTPSAEWAKRLCCGTYITTPHADGCRVGQ
jgi:hypothetical protein